MLSETLAVAEEFPPVPYDEWRALVDRDLKGAPFEKKLVTHTYEGIEIRPLYTGDDSAGPDAAGLPGLFPRTRAALPLGNFTCGWDIRQERAEADPAVFNERLLDDLHHGVTSALVRFDAAARRGMDATDRAAAPLCGVDGSMLYSLEELHRAFAGVHLNMIGIALEAGASFLPASALLIALWKRRGVELSSAWGAFNADPLAVLARDGRVPMSLDRAFAQMSELATYAHEYLPRCTSVRVGSAPLHHAGANAAQDLAFSMATGVEYLRRLTGAGLSLPAASNQLLFSYAVGCNFFLAASKLRAGRRLWSRIIEAAGGEADAHRMRLHVRTSRRVITARDPWVNMLRNTVCAFAAGVAQADSITTVPYDAAIGPPSEQAARIARNTQIILQEESHLHRVVDPAGGCWFVESLTDELCEKAWTIFQEIERQGGMAEALTRGWVAEQIDSAFTPRAKNIATRKDAITGVSEFPHLGEQRIEPEKPNLEVLREAAAARASHACADELMTLRSAESVARVDLAIAAAKAGATIGSLAEALGRGHAEELDAPISPHPYAEPFEELREASDRHLALTGVRPRVFLATVGSAAEHTARATFSRNFFEAGGFEVLGSERDYETADGASDAFAQSAAGIAVICSSDPVYETAVPELAPALHNAGARSVVLAGFPGAKKDEYERAGVDRFIYIKCDVLAVLRELLAEEGVLS
ncbi:MAG: methylmalonyl-CoA mutase family protein [Planctomycetota bacterium]